MTAKHFDRLFSLLFVGIVLLSIAYMTWVVFHIGLHWWHLYWAALGVFGHIVLFRVERLLWIRRKEEFLDADFD